MRYSKASYDKGPTKNPIKSFWKSVGLNVINFLDARLKTIHGNEEPKIALDGRKWVAVIRVCMVHILPMSATIVVLYFLLSNFYIGGNLSGSNSTTTDNTFMNILQFVAKGQEIVVLASLATMVADFTKHRACAGGGVSFATLSAQFSFSSLGYLVSPELWSAVSCSPRRTRQSNRKEIWKQWFLKWFFICGLVTITFLAGFIGPATAVAIIPAIDWFPASITTFYVTPLDGTTYELPTNITLSNVDPNCLTGDQLDDIRCPYSGYYSHKAWSAGLIKNALLGFRASKPNNPKVVTPDFTTEVHFPEIPDASSMPTRCSQPMIRDLAELASVADDWRESISGLEGYDKTRYNYQYRLGARATFEAPAPRTLVYCMSPQTVDETTSQISFPLQGSNGWSTPLGGRDGLTNFNSSSQSTQSVRINITDGSSISTLWAKWIGANGTENLVDNNWRLQWVPSFNLDAADLAVASARAVIYSPTSSNSNTTQRNAYACSVLSHWSNTTSTIEMGDELAMRRYSSDQSIVQEDYRVKKVFTDEGKQYRNMIDEPPIALDESWLKMLTPVIHTSTNTSEGRGDLMTDNVLTNALGVFVPDFLYFSRGKVVYSPEISYAFAIEQVLCLTVSDGLSRVGSREAGDSHTGSNSTYENWSDKGHALVRNRPIYNLPIAQTGWNGKPQIIRLMIEVQGYGYKTSTITAWLTVVVLASHFLFGLTHILWTLVRGEHYLHWDTFPELLALAINSDKSELLTNCCAGIDKFSTLRLQVQIGHLENKQLGIVFKEEVKDRDIRAVEKDVLYPECTKEDPYGEGSSLVP